MTDPNTCPACAAPLAGAAVGGLCPRCLMETAVTAPTPAPALEPAPSPLALAPHFPQYELQLLLGQGGMGAVYRARHTKLDRLVAIKVLRPELSRDPEFAERFEREARALARLDHPGIVRVHDFGEAAGSFFLAMEYVEGASLRDLLQDGRMTAKDVLAFIPQICDALQYAHDQGVVHRDIKPENLLVDQEGRVRIADFGLAKLMGSEAGPLPVTQTRQALGTPHYMAPEQVSGSGAVDHRADIYSLGVVFYELLTGNLPIGRFAPPSASDAANQPLDPVVMRSLENDPERRYQQASEVKDGIGSEWVSKDEPPVGQPDPAPAEDVAPRSSGQELSWSDAAMFALVLASCFMPWLTYGGMSMSGWSTLTTVFGISVPNWTVLLCAGGVVALRGARRAGADVPGWSDPLVAALGYMLPTIAVLSFTLGQGSINARGPWSQGGELSIGSGALLAWVTLGAWILQAFIPKLQALHSRQRELRTAAAESRAVAAESRKRRRAKARRRRRD